MKPPNKYRKLVKARRGEWMTKQFGSAIRIVGFIRYSDKSEVWFKRTYCLDKEQE